MRILSFGQVMNLEGGLGFIHQLTVELPTGERHVITTDEGTVQQLIAIMAGLGNEVMEDSPYPTRSTGNPVGRVIPQEEYDPDLAAAPDPEAWDGEGATIFGGDANDPGEVGQLVDQVPDLSPPQAGGIGFSQPQQQQLQVVNPPKILPNGKVIPPKAKTVPRDEMGYPIVPKRPVRAAAAGIGQAVFSEDEDGTQI